MEISIFFSGVILGAFFGFVVYYSGVGLRKHLHVRSKRGREIDRLIEDFNDLFQKIKQEKFP